MFEKEDYTLIIRCNDKEKIEKIFYKVTAIVQFEFGNDVSDLIIPVKENYMLKFYSFGIKLNDRSADNSWPKEAKESERLIKEFLKNEYDPKEVEVTYVSYR